MSFDARLTRRRATFSSARTALRRPLRILGTTLVVVGVLTLAWAFVVWKWNDPFTGLYTRYEQGKLRGEYASERIAFENAYLRRRGSLAPTTPPRASKTAWITAERKAIAAQARLYRATTTEGEAIGKIMVPRLGLHMILVDGTDEGSLERGPGRDLQTYMPGQGQLVYIAGHRTTFLAPFANIDQLRPGDTITLSVPYGRFVYRVYGHVIVPANDLARLRSHGREVVALQACNPRFFATQRYIVYGRLVSVRPTHGKAFRVSA